MEPLNAVALAAIPKKRPNSARLLAKSYTCDRCLSKSAAAGESADVGRPGSSVAPTAPRGDGQVSGSGEQSGVSRVGRLALNVLQAIKTNEIKQLLSIVVNSGRYKKPYNHL